MDIQKLQRLTEAYITDTLSAEEGVELAKMLQQPAYQLSFKELLHTQLHQQTLDLDAPPGSSLERILQSLDTQIQQGNSVRRTPLLLRWKNIAAAIIVLVIGSGIYIFRHQSKKILPISQQTNVVREILPGTSKAILTLANGTQKELGTADNGLPLQADAVLLTTPNGGQYQAVLPDGSKVWLNAASGIKFPSSFNHKERKVEVTGEVYLEVAQNPRQPFIVNAGGAEIQVLGTSFNINAYEDEAVLKTTLVTGAVKISMAGHSRPLRPGQQAVVKPMKGEGEPIIVQSVDPGQVLAWKNGLFDFNGLSFEEIMRQLGRWYDIKIVYENNIIPNKQLAGEMTRGVSLNDLLKQLGELGIHYKLNDRTLTVLP
ncbi:FecR domain-containing protein [Chitinophaga qingshengii]|uniref:FecR domain-containing protein n=1 Tax=Chitinophaga qingshengii TaxID=1569794 RepID=A0ABR7TI27_9BACT|nr:FecR domain-containing protein [Chitinophaga qingshengii]MBC9929156.1 FecR domain-containing protein [Chitinophaga qingshengii]